MSIIQRASRWVRGPTDSCAVGGRVNLRHLPTLECCKARRQGWWWTEDTVAQLQKCPEARSDTGQTLTECVVQSVPAARHACFIFCLLAGSDGQEPAWRSTSAWCARARTSMLFSMFYSGFVHLCIGIHATKPHINIIMWSTPLTACFCVNLFDIAGV